MTSNQHGPYVRGDTRVTMAGHRGEPCRKAERIPKTRLSSDRSLQPDSVKLDSLVIAHQPWRGEYVPGPTGRCGWNTSFLERGAKNRSAADRRRRRHRAAARRARTAPATGASKKTESRDRAQALTETVKTYRWKKSCKQEKKGLHGGLAQLARAPALHAGGHRFESVILHDTKERSLT